MEIEFDPNKDEINRAKHGVSLTLAAGMEFATAMIQVDDRYDYGEARFQAIGVVSGRLYLLAFTMRGEIVRAISLRKADGKETRRYAESQATLPHFAEGLG